MRPYLPGFFALLFGFLCARFPGIAVFLVSGAAFSFGVIYTLVVYKIQGAKKKMAASAAASGATYSTTGTTWSNNDAGSTNRTPVEEPTFKNVTTFMFRDGRWIRDNNRT